MRRTVLAVLVLCTLTVGLGVASYHRARGQAASLVGPLPPEVLQFHNGVVPLRRDPYARRWGWVISYGPEVGDAHAEVYVSPWSGRIVGTNPPALLDRMRARQAPNRSRSRPTT